MDDFALNDFELTKLLNNFGVDVGPITNTTRKFYLKKLNTLQNNNFPVKASNLRSSTTPKRRSARFASLTSESKLAAFSSDEDLASHEVLKQPSQNAPVSLKKKRNITPKVSSRLTPPRVSKQSLEEDLSPSLATKSSKLERQSRRSPVKGYLYSNDLHSNTDEQLQVSDVESEVSLNGNFNQPAVLVRRNNLSQLPLPSTTLEQGCLVQDNATLLAVSNMLIFLLCLAIILIASVYLLMDNQHYHKRRLSSIRDAVPLEYLSDAQLFVALKVARPLQQLLAEHAGAMICNSTTKDTSISIETAHHRLKQITSGIKLGESEWNSTLVTIRHVGHLLGIRLEKNGVEKLSAVEARLSILCRIRRQCLMLLVHLQFLIKWVLLFLLMLGSGLAVRLLRQWHVNRQLSAHRRCAAALEQLLDVLEREDTLESGLPLAEVERILSVDGEGNLINFKDLQQVVYADGQQVIIDEIPGVGEVWRARPRTNSIAGRGWQGSVLAATASQQQQHIRRAPDHPCLKLRGMLRSQISDVTKDLNDLEERVKLDLIEYSDAKDGQILHMGFDHRQGVVYCRCVDTFFARELFNRCNKHFYQGQLVTVSILTLQKYLLRFPEATVETDSTNNS